MAAAFRSVGVDAAVTPNTNHESLELGSRHSSGDECLPHKITLGDFLRVTEEPDFDPAQTAFFMPMAPGPCRFGQYAPYLKQVLREQGLDDVLVVSPSSASGYDEIGAGAGELMHVAWMSIVLGDLLTRFLLKTRPYERTPGDADAVFRASIEDFAEVLSIRALPHKNRIAWLTDVVVRVRDRFRAIPANYEKGRPLIGLVGEIFCRLNTFSNEDVARHVEQLGGECWISDISEWIWYTNWCRESDCLRERGWLNLEYMKLRIKSHVQHKYEQALLAPVKDDFKGYEEPADFREVVAASEPYLPAQGAHGEMAVSVGKAVYLYRQGIDGIIDISPFTCMNGIVSEAVYPAVSADHDDLPIRVLYFDKVGGSAEGDLEIFMELARAYQRRKRQPRTYPDYFA